MSKYHYSIMRDPTIKNGLRTSSKTDRDGMNGQDSQLALKKVRSALTVL